MAWSVPAVNAVVVIVKVPLDCPAGMVMLAGTCTKLLLLESVGEIPPEGAGMLSVTVPTEELPLTTVLGFSVSEETATVAPQMPGVPPPPHVCGAVQEPQLRVPPQPSEALPQLKPSPAHVFGVQAPGLMVRFALADLLLQLADAATVNWSWALTAEVESVTAALLAPTGTVTVPVQAGDPVQPGKVAI